jgi:hypothetical protein
MIALIRYTLAITLHSQRYLPPVGAYVLAMGLFTSEPTGPAVPLFAPMAGALFACSAWLAVAVVNVEDPVQRTITAVHAGRPGAVLTAAVWVVLGACAALTALVLTVPVLLGHHHVTVTDLAVGAEAQVTAACLGTAIGLPCSRPVLRRPGYSLITALAAVVAFAFLKGVPPINPLIRMLAEDRPSASLLAPVGAYAAAAAVALVTSAALTRSLAARRV